MTVKIRPYRKGGWEIDIMIRLDNGERYRERRKAPVDSKSGALRWGQRRERHLLTHGPNPVTPATTTSPEPELEQEERKVPTLAEFAPRFVDGHARANRQKPSSIDSIERTLRAHLLPAFGSKQLDELSQEDIQLFKGQRSKLSPKTINNILSILRTALTAAVTWGVIERMPVEIRMMKVPKPSIEFFDFDEFETLVATAEKIDPRVWLAVLLGGEAGLRAGEIRALEWSSLDLRRKMLTVERAEWEGHVTLPKHNKIRRVPLTSRLARALSSHRHLQGMRVLYRDGGLGLNGHTIRDWLTVACRGAGLAFKSPHCLRHTFCSHLAMRGAPVRSIQELAGHSDLKTTQRYMHLTPTALEGAIRLLEEPAPKFGEAGDHGRGDIVETV